MLVLLSIPLTLSLPVMRHASQQVNFDFGWRYWLGGNPPLPSTPCPASAFPINRSGVECVSLTRTAFGDGSAEVCRSACCANPACSTWQYMNYDDVGTCFKYPVRAGDKCLALETYYGTNNITTMAHLICPHGKLTVGEMLDICGCTNHCKKHPHGACWTGDNKGCPYTSSVWVGGERNVTDPSVAPLPADISYNDSQWSIVDTPHDFVITGEYTEAGPQVSNSQGNLPKNVSWYRKRFALPSDWKGMHIDLYIEASYSVATYYLNGKLLGKHANGYTSSIFRLDRSNFNLTYGGGDNVLAIYIDATLEACTGWWYEGKSYKKKIIIWKKQETREKKSCHFLDM